MREGSGEGVGSGKGGGFVSCNEGALGSNVQRKRLKHKQVVGYRGLCVVLLEAVLGRWEEELCLGNCVSDDRATTG